MMDATSFAGLAAALSVMAYLPYALAVLFSAARPQRSSWLIWSVLSATALAAVLSSGGTQGVPFTASQTAGTITIFLLSLRRGTGSLGSRSDAIVLGVAAFGIALWMITDSPGYAMALSIAIGALGGSLTVLKAYRSPGTEALGPWALQTFAAVFGVASVLGATALEMAYPVYLLVLYTAILTAAIFGRGLSSARIRPLRPRQSRAVSSTSRTWRRKRIVSPSSL